MITTITLWVLLALMLFSMVTSVTQIGKERKPVTPAVAAGTLSIQMVLVALIGISLMAGR